MPSIIDIRHPDYSKCQQKWEKWRLTYEAGDNFIQKYLERFSIRESSFNYNLRHNISYCPAFAQSGVDEIKNSIYQRITDVIRDGGSDSYHLAVDGKNGGVDLLGSSMSYFMGQKILRELLPMSKVGIYVDMPDLPDRLTKNDIKARHPYLYYYCIEDILSWRYDLTDSPNEYSAILLRDCDYEYDDDTYLPTSKASRYRYIYLKDNQVYIKFYDEDGNQTDKYGNPSAEAILLNINKIPFYILDINESLLNNVSNYQIALLNIESADLAYSLLSNYPFYTEQFEAKSESGYTNTNEDDEDVEVGLTQGRRYPVGLDRPGFIHPSSEPLQASMIKADNIKRDIRILINLAVSNISPKNSSAESKTLDLSGLQAGLSYIGLILQNAENKIGEYWALYESSTPPSISYPIEYSLPDPEQTRQDIDQYITLIEAVNSETYRKELTRRIVHRTIGNRVNVTVINKIENEIDSADIVAVSPDTLRKDLESGIVSTKTASITRGYPKGDDEIAKTDYANRLALIQAAQTTRVAGVNDTTQQNINEKQASQITDNSTTTKVPVRGEGK